MPARTRATRFPAIARPLEPATAAAMQRSIETRGGGERVGGRGRGEIDVLAAGGEKGSEWVFSSSVPHRSHGYL